MDQEWYFCRDGENCGPFSAADMRAHVSNGTLRRDDLIWKQGMAQWIPAARIKGLFPGNTVPPPVPVNESPTAPAVSSTTSSLVTNNLKEKAYQNAAQIVQDVRRNFHLQRIAIIMVAIVGAGSALMPWVVFDENTVYAFRSDGWVLICLFAPAIVFSLIGNRLEPLGHTERWVLVASAGLAGLIAVQRIANPNSAFGLLTSIRMFALGMDDKVTTHIGPYIATLAAIAIGFVAFRLSRPVTTELSHNQTESE